MALRRRRRAAQPGSHGHRPRPRPRGRAAAVRRGSPGDPRDLPGHEAGRCTGHLRLEGHSPLCPAGRPDDHRGGLGGGQAARLVARGDHAEPGRGDPAEDSARGAGADRLVAEQRREDDDLPLLAARSHASDGGRAPYLGRTRAAQPGPARLPGGAGTGRLRHQSDRGSGLGVRSGSRQHRQADPLPREARR